ncbi:MAG TPA: T9SS type A sorting domain-containing protein [Ignavibacteriaceae bacterium]|nr:T9SS type A sorting domain-containing protein [Ignavibacteriaceae bacterium]
MKLGKNIVLMLLLFAGILQSQEERKVLVEVFTNSHCSLCPAAHNVIDNYLAGPNGNKISYIYYHMVYPYPDDLLYQQSMEGSEARHAYYNPVAATPRGIFDGQIQGSTSGWAATLDNLVNIQSPLKIELSGYTDLIQLFIDADVTRTGDIIDNDLVIHFVVAEHVFYDGRNSISNHKHVMRKMLPTPAGLQFNIALNETKGFQQVIDLDTIWDIDSLKIIVFVQSLGSKTIYQSETIEYSELVWVNVDDEELTPAEFILEQNYPNPFNPSTKISWQSPIGSWQTLIVYDLLGREVATLVDEFKQAGSYEIEFNASDLPSGIYFYKLQAGKFTSTKKLILIK